MKKLLIATAALAMVAGTAQAQSSVSVYGSIDAGFGDTETKTSNVGARSKEVTASGLTGGNAAGALTSSRLGFRGTEDLGGGLSAQFNIEYGFTPGNGTTTVSNIRTSTVGLSSSKFGSFNIGRQLTGMHGVLTATSPIAANNIAGDIQYSDSVAATDLAGVSLRQHRGTHGIEAVRASNSISYVTPAFSGLTARVDYASDKSDSDSTTLNKNAKLDHLGLAATYNKGPLLVTAGTHTVKAKAATADAITSTNQVSATGVVSATAAAVTTANDESKFSVDAIAARYTLGAVKLNAIYSQKKQSYEGVEGYKQDAMQFGVSYDIGKTTLAGQYGTGSTKFGQGGTFKNGAKQDNSAYQLAAIYNMSKRTNVYAAYGMDERETKQDSLDGSFGTVGDKVKRTVYAVGLRHSF